MLAARKAQSLKNTINKSSDHRVAAAIVAYFPDRAVIEDLIVALHSQVDALYLFCNGANEIDQAQFAHDTRLAHYAYFPQNPGLGFALNEALTAAQKNLCTHLLLFDQDSAVDDMYVTQMLEQLEHATVLSGPNISIAAIGPSFYDIRHPEQVETQFRYRGRRIDVSRNSEPVRVDCLITSGMLLNLNKLKTNDRFDESYFVDQVDSEWCFRIGAQGFWLFAAPSVRLGHRLSDHQRRIGSWTFLQYSPIRRYWFYKNCTRMIKSSNTPWIWKLRLASIMLIWFIPNLFIDRQPLATLMMMAKGIFSGLFTPSQGTSARA